MGVTARAIDDDGVEARRELHGLLDEAETRAVERNLHEFIRRGWSSVEPHQPYKDNWHIGALADHLGAVDAGQIRKLLINVPPATSKSLTVSVFYPSWAWARRPWLKFLCASFDQTLATRDNLRTRLLIQSEWYSTRWPAVQLSAEQNEKTRFNTTAGGWRIATSIGGRIVGEHMHVKIVDDPHNTRRQVLSDAEVKQATEFWDYGLGPRGVTLDAATILLMQRISEKDLSAYVLSKNDPAWVHLCLPMKYEPPTFIDLGAGRHELRPRMKMTPIGFQDPRTEPGELLWPEEWTAEKVEATIQNELGSWGESGQFQQRPAPLAGLMFHRDWFRVVHDPPSHVVARIRSWDVAGTEGGSGPRTVGLRMERERDGLFVITSIVKGRWGDARVDREMLQTAQLDGVGVTITEEQEPGSSGKAVINAHRRLLAGYAYRGLSPSDNKVTRARPLRSQAEGGNVALLVRLESDGTPNAEDAATARDFLDEISTFPAGALKDQIDAASQALNVLTDSGGVDLDITTGESVINPDDPVYREAYERALAAYRGEAQT